MRLLVVSHTEHYLRGSEPVGWGATVREIDQLAADYDEVRHVACLHPGDAPASALPYRSSRVTFVPVPAAGGERLSTKLGILHRWPHYVRVLRRELRHADVVHVRAPANISLVALLLLVVVRAPTVRWAKYAGSWRRYPGEAPSYALQRWLLGRRLHRGVVTVNGEWPGQPAHVHTFLNPCLDDDDLAAARTRAPKRWAEPIRLVFVGRVETAKGVGCAVAVVARLRDHGVDARLDLVGDGPERERFAAEAERLGVRDRITFHGWLPRPAINPLYADAHFMVLPSTREGWPKVLSEAMAFGVVPLAGAVGSIPHHLRAFGTGAAIASSDPDDYAREILACGRDPARWATQSEMAVEAAVRFTYEAYRRHVRLLLGGASPDAAGRPDPRRDVTAPGAATPA